MQVTQSYAAPSTATASDDGMKFSFSAELSRPPVRLDALIKNSLSYARIMLALRQVVTGDWRTKQKDNTAYQEWVTGKYIEELPSHLQNLDPKKVKMLEEREKLNLLRKNINKDIKPLQNEIYRARTEYFQWLYKHDRDKWIVLDPVISVHPDSVIFEAFSLDESAYGRVSVTSDLLETFGDVDYGTTNIDFSIGLANEIYRVRSYRPAWLKVAFEKVELSTDIGTSVEKKIDLPESWVRGFLQVQSASTLDGVSLELHSQTMAEVLCILEQKREKVSPRSIRFRLKKGEPAVLIVDPWNIEVIDKGVYNGDFEGEIRLWGRRRLLVLKELLPYTDKVSVKLLGTGMPSYWTVVMDGHRFDLGLSGWTSNDWAKKGNFDLLASTGNSNKVDIKQVEQELIKQLAISPKGLADAIGIQQADATFALQELCKNGQAMYDHLTGTYRWRQLLKQDIQLTNTEEDDRLKYAITLIKEKKVKTIDKKPLEDGFIEYQMEVQGKNLYKPVIRLDLDGRIKFAECNCGFHRRNKLRQGPCPHIMASVIEISRG